MVVLADTAATSLGAAVVLLAPRPHHRVLRVGGLVGTAATSPAAAGGLVVTAAASPGAAGVCWVG